MVAVVAFLLAAYVGWLVWLTSKIWRQDGPSQKPGLGLTVLVAFRNEEANLPHLMAALEANRHSIQRIILVDDGSTDSSFQLAQAWKDAHLGIDILFLLNKGKPGKRGAIETGMGRVETSWVLQTDADCRPSADWAAQVAAHTHGPADLVILPLRFRCDRLSPFWLSAVNMEFASVMAVTCGMARMGRPVMCNGANLAYKQSLYQEALPSMQAQHHVGGDDMFLLDYAVSHKHPITYHDAPAVWLDTEAPATLGAFFRQRQRWSAKWSGYQNRLPLALGLLTILGQGSFLAAFALVVFGVNDGYLLGVILAKTAVEATLLQRQLAKGGMRFSIGAFLFWQVAYMPYILAAALPSLWQRKPVPWKN